MNYVKLTVAGFKERLEAGDYNGLTGARRAIGKVAGWSEKDRNEARKLADAYFANAPKAAKAAAPKKVFYREGAPEEGRSQEGCSSETGIEAGRGCSSEARGGPAGTEDGGQESSSREACSRRVTSCPPRHPCGHSAGTGSV